MKLFYIEKLNTFVLSNDNGGWLSADDQKHMKKRIEDRLSGIEPAPHVVVTNASFEIIHGDPGIVQMGRNYRVFEHDKEQSK